MSVFVSVEIKGLDELVALWRQAPKLTQQEMHRGMTETTLLAERNIKKETPKGAGGSSGLLGSISAGLPVPVDSGVVGFVGTSLMYAPAVELGSRPHFPPVLSLVDWVESVLGISGERARTVAFLIARKISRVGTKGKFMFKEGVENSQEQFQTIFNKTIERIREALLP